MNKHLKLLQWCIDNTDENFTANYNYGIDQSWISGTVTINCISENEVDAAIEQLEKEKADYTPEKIAEKRKVELLEELEKVNATLPS